MISSCVRALCLPTLLAAALVG
ncbi:MAG: hypothetical protein RL071_4160, partial [Pseudomonadota bacterium]